MPCYGANILILSKNKKNFALFCTQSEGIPSPLTFFLNCMLATFKGQEKTMNAEPVLEKCKILPKGSR